MQIFSGRSFQKGETAGAKVLGWECAWHALETPRSLGCSPCGSPHGAWAPSQQGGWHPRVCPQGVTQAEAVLPVAPLPWESRGVTAVITKPHPDSGVRDVDSALSRERTAREQEILFTENMIHQGHRLGFSLGAQTRPGSQAKAPARKGQHRPHPEGVPSLSEGPDAAQECGGKGSADGIGATQKGFQKERSLSGDLNLIHHHIRPYSNTPDSLGSTLQELSHFFSLAICFCGKECRPLPIAHIRKLRHRDVRSFALEVTQLITVDLSCEPHSDN